MWAEGQRKMWGRKLNASSSTDELLKLLTQLESAIKQDYLSSNFETTRELLGSSLQSENDSSTVSVLPWIPQTTPAVALRLLELDSSVMYVKPEKVEPPENREARASYIKLSSRTSLFIKNKELELKELDQDEHMKENFTDLSNSKRSSYKRGRGTREQGSGRKWQRKGSGSKSDAGKQIVGENKNLSFQLKQQSQRTGQSSGHGRRTVRKRAESRAANSTIMARMSDVVKPKADAVSVRDLDEEWRTERFGMMATVNPPDSNSTEEESDDDGQGEGYGQGNWELGLNGASNGWSREPLEASYEEDDAYEDDNGIEQVVEEESDGDLEMSDASDDVPNETRNDVGSDSADSEDYSD
ncbi:hypothetical protein Golob_006739 [Gossypium lobatum]|uniref:Uncharacterized protein n=1 Tax=Gossypium lobatum TaxID=34289 RepID=A0A7J8MX91_9ROSI|nr:hypothetical protein [Gossypium lobatum]